MVENWESRFVPALPPFKEDEIYRAGNPNGRCMRRNPGQAAGFHFLVLKGLRKMT